MNSGNMGLFNGVTAALADSNNVTQAVALNAAINDTNTVEYYKKTVYDIYLNGSAINIPLTYSDTVTLDYIAHLTWIQAGEAKYMAAAMLGLEIHPTPGNSNRGYLSNNINSNDKKESENDLISAFPNPAKDKLFISGLKDGFDEIEIYDCYSRLVCKKINNRKDNSIDISALSNGLYFLRIKNSSDNYVKTSFTILK